jgi:uncharacterized membrane protein
MRGERKCISREFKPLHHLAGRMPPMPAIFSPGNDHDSALRAGNSVGSRATVDQPRRTVPAGARRATKQQQEELMHTIEQSIEVDAPAQAVYNQWTQFEEFPRFMEGIEAVRQLDDKRLHFTGNVGGRRHEWEAEIFEQIPEQKIAWRSLAGKRNDGTVFFEKLAENRTRVRAVIAFEPEGVVEKAGDALGIASARVKGDLKRFKEFLENRGHETGAWRGEIHGGDVSR